MLTQQFLVGIFEQSSSAPGWTEHVVYQNQWVLGQC